MNKLMLIGSAMLAVTLTACPSQDTKIPSNTQPSTKNAFGNSFSSAQSTGSGSVQQTNVRINTLVSKLKVPSGLNSLASSAVQPFAAALEATKQNPALLRNPEGLLRSLSSSLNARVRTLASGGTGELPRGLYDCSSGTCPEASAANDDLIIKWKADISGDSALETIEFVADWNVAGSSTAQVWSSGTSYQELPTNAKATLKAGGVTLLEGNFKAAWHPQTGVAGKFVATPDNLEFNGYLFDGSVRVVDIRAFKISTSNTGLASNADIGVNDGGVVSSLKWNLALNGVVTRSAEGNLANLVPSGRSDVGLELVSGSHAVKLQVGLDNWVYSSGQLQSVKLIGGILQADSSAVLFAGDFDNSDADCVPGENVTLTFSDGTTTLEQFLIDNGIIAACSAETASR